jgi:hypothetical protein
LVFPACPLSEEPREPGLSGLLRSTATNLSSRQRMARQLADWSSFFLLPEGVARELRGQGLLSWANDNVWVHMQDRRAPPGTVRVSACLDCTPRCGVNQLQLEIEPGGYCLPAGC